MPDFMIELTGTHDEVQAMLNVASKVEPGCYKKKWVTPGQCNVWVRGDEVGPPNDLVAKIKREAGLKRASAPKSKEAEEPKAE